MRRRIILFTLAVLNTLTASSAIANGPQIPEQQEPYLQGEYWRYSIIDDLRNVNVEQTHEVAQTVDGGKAWILETYVHTDRKLWRLYDSQTGFYEATRKYDPSKTNLRGAQTLSPARESRLQFPLAIGKSYSIVENWPNGLGSNKLDLKVKSTEKINTAAGEFEVWRIAFSGTFAHFTDAEQHGDAKGEFWYSPLVKRIVKSEAKDYFKGRAVHHEVIELLEWRDGQKKASQ
jgi:hypothetical protein